MCDRLFRRTSQVAMQGAMNVATKEQWQAGGGELIQEQTGLFYGVGGGPQEVLQVQMGSYTNAQLRPSSIGGEVGNGRGNQGVQGDEEEDAL